MELRDMVVNLNDIGKLNYCCNSTSVKISRAVLEEKETVVSFVNSEFTGRWTNQFEESFSGDYITCFVAKENDQIIGFCCYDVKAKSLFGPIGIAKKYRNLGIGAAIALSIFSGMRADGYAYAILCGVSDAQEFYQKCFNAMLLPSRVVIPEIG